jgi:hypothetical protein
LFDNNADDYWTTFAISALVGDADSCATYAGQTGTVGYTEDIETYLYLTFTGTGENWRFATYDEMYSTNTNGGYFPWDDNKP